MAEFCRQCLLEDFGEDLGDLKGLSTEKDTKNNLYCVVICEGCGVIQVDHLGNCVSEDCYRKHGAKENSVQS